MMPFREFGILPYFYVFIANIFHIILPEHCRSLYTNINWNTHIILILSKTIWVLKGKKGQLARCTLKTILYELQLYLFALIQEAFLFNKLLTGEGTNIKPILLVFNNQFMTFNRISIAKHNHIQSWI
jgi:hypothetical protein